MAWVRLDDQFPDHPKVAGLSNDAFCLHVTAMCWVAKQQTDGNLPSSLLKRLAWRCQDAATAAAELEAAGVWDKTPDGWEIHDFLVYNPTKEQVVELAAKRSDAGKAGAMARWQDHSKHDGKSHSKPDGKIMPPAPAPAPAPAQSQIPQKATDLRDVSLSEEAPINGKSSASAAVGLSAVAVLGRTFLNQIGFQNPDRFIGQVDETLLAQWAFYYSCLTETEKRSIKSWPALVNDRVRSNKAPRMSDQQKTRFYQELERYDH